MNDIRYTCTKDSRDSLTVGELSGGALTFITEQDDSFTGSAWLSPDDIADLVRRLSEHAGLTIEPEPFKRDAEVEDIRKGDLVRVETVMDDLTITRTGVAHSLLSSGWYTPSRELLCGLMFGGTVTILSRPEPDPLPTTPGAVIKLWLGEESGWTTLGMDGYWRGNFPDGGGMQCASDRLDEHRGIDWDSFEVIA